MEKKKGFTLIEIIVVVLILAIILILVMTNFFKASKNARQKTYDSKVAMIEDSAVMYGQDFYADIVKNGERDEEGNVTITMPISKLVPNYVSPDNEVEGKQVDDPRETNQYLDEKIVKITVNTKTRKITASLVDGEDDKQDGNILVTLNANGGTVSPKQKDVKFGETYGSLPTPTKKGYTFDGWYTSMSGGELVNTSTKIIKNSNHTLYAHWSGNQYAITFNANGGSEVSTIFKPYGSTVTSFPNSNRTGYTFDGWYTEISGGTRVTSLTVTSDVTLYAHWTKEVTYYTLSFKSEDGSSTYSTTQVEAGATATNFPTPPSRSGYTFAGWYNQTTGGERKTSLLMNSNQSLYARWTANMNNVMMARVENDKIWKHQNIVKIVFETTMSAKSNASYTYDISLNQDRSVMAYVVPSTAYSGNYELYIQANGKIKANPDCSYYFSNFYVMEFVGMNNLDTSNVTNMSHMFENASYLTTSLDLNNFITSKVTDMSYMFYGCSAPSINISNFDTSKVTNMSNMFSRSINLTSLNLSNFVTNNVTDMSYMFWGCYGLTSLNVSSFKTHNVTNMGYMFSSCSNLTSLNVKNFDTSKVISMFSMFSNLSKVTALDLSNFNTSNVMYMDMMFNNSGVTSLNLNNFNTSKVVSMEGMFSVCFNLTSLNISSFNTSNVANMKAMFSSCYKLTSINITNFDTRKVTEMASMFSECNSLTTLNLNNFNTSNVTKMSYMFYNCSELTSLNLGNFDTRKVTSTHSMFRGCQKLTTTITIRGTACTEYDYMFHDAAYSSKGAKITVNYDSSSSNLVYTMVSQKPAYSNVIKGSLVS